MKAIIMQGGESAALVHDRPLPSLRPGYVLVRVRAVALNPTDWKHIKYANTPGLLTGFDYSGVVEELGEGYEKDWKVGDRIAGSAHGANHFQPEDGAFAEFIVVKADVQLRIPAQMSFEEAATLGVGIHTCGQGLFMSLGLVLPGAAPITGDPILIYGGSSASGALGIQFAKLAGYTVITTCSPHNFDLVRSLGADHVFDYNDPECALKIRQAANDRLHLVWDTISIESSAQICAHAIASGGKYSSLLIVSCPREDVTSDYIMGYTALGEPVDKPWIPYRKDDVRDDFAFAKIWATQVETLLVSGKLKAHSPKVSTSGLEGCFDGLDLLQQDKVSGQKLVYSLASVA